MYILGITESLGRNNAAALIKDGKLIAAAEEERFLRLKHSPQIPPLEAAKYCLRQANIDISDVDYIAVGFLPPLTTSILNLTQNLKEANFKSLLTIVPGHFLYSILMYRIKKLFRELNPDSDKFPKWFFIPHHIAHAASSFSVSGFKKANIITIDASGEDESGILAFGHDSKIEKIHKIGLRDSLGTMYARATGVLGFIMNSQEGKTMGLAAYGQPDEEFIKRIIKIENGLFSLQKGYQSQVIKKFGSKKAIDPLSESSKILAASIQRIVEDAGINFAKHLFEKRGIKNFCLAGGVTLNCDMNAKILALPFVKNIFIQPAAHDAGCALGAAFEAYSRLGGKIDFVMEHAYWGPEYSNQEIEQVLKESKLRYRRCEDIEEDTARLLSKGKIVGWFQGRMEIGPRALGNRSILTHPGLEHMKDKVNAEVKHREMWRPFAPSILEEDAPDYLEGYYPSPFMLLTFNVKEDKKRFMSQATHVDGTARVQTVNKKTNPKYYKLIDSFKRLTGIPVVLNTSFNDKGEPLVMSPKDALRTFSSTGMDVLAVGDFLIEKDKL